MVVLCRRKCAHAHAGHQAVELIFRDATEILRLFSARSERPSAPNLDSLPTIIRSEGYSSRGLRLYAISVITTALAEIGLFFSLSTANVSIKSVNIPLSYIERFDPAITLLIKSRSPL